MPLILLGGHHQKSVLNQGVHFLRISGMFYPGYLPVQPFVVVSIDYWYVPMMQWHLCQFLLVSRRLACILSPRDFYHS